MYGLSWISLPAQIACWTWIGASAGAAAVPSGRSCATEPGTVRLTGVGGGGGGGGWKAAPPDLSGAGVCATAVAGRTSINDVIARAYARRENNRYSSFVGLRG